MYPYTPSLPALSTNTFHILLALARGPAHGYAIGAIITNDSHGALQLTDSTLYQLLKRLFDFGYIEIASHEGAKKPGQTKISYAITDEGMTRLQADLKRLQHAIAIADAAGLVISESATGLPASSYPKP